jgi:hypothetical protein
MPPAAAPTSEKDFGKGVCKLHHPCTVYSRRLWAAVFSGFSLPLFRVIWMWWFSGLKLIKEKSDNWNRNLVFDLRHCADAVMAGGVTARG